MHRVPSQFWFLVRFTCLGKNPKFLNVHRWIPSVGSRCGITERDGGRAWRSKPLLGKSLLEDRKYVFLQYNALKAINLPDDEKPVMLFFPGNVFWLPDQGSIWLLLISLSFFFSLSFPTCTSVGSWDFFGQGWGPSIHWDKDQSKRMESFQPLFILKIFTFSSHISYPH